MSSDTIIGFLKRSVGIAYVWPGSGPARDATLEPKNLSGRLPKVTSYSWKGRSVVFRTLDGCRTTTKLQGMAKPSAAARMPALSSCRIVNRERMENPRSASIASFIAVVLASSIRTLSDLPPDPLKACSTTEYVVDSLSLEMNASPDRSSAYILRRVHGWSGPLRPPARRPGGVCFRGGRGGPRRPLYPCSPLRLLRPAGSPGYCP